MPRWLKVLLSMVLLLGVIGFHVLEWRVQDSLVVCRAGVEREQDGSLFLNFEFHNRSKFPIKVTGVAILYGPGDYGVGYFPPEQYDALLLKAGAQYNHRVKLQYPQVPVPSIEGLITVDWVPASASWLEPIFGRLEALYKRGHPSGSNLMPDITRSVNQDFVMHQTEQGNPEWMELRNERDEWLLFIQNLRLGR